MGDIFYYDDKGLYYFIDRIKRITKIFGYTICPSIIENLIMENKSVRNCVIARKMDADEKSYLTAYLQISEDTNFDAVTNSIKTEILKNLDKYHLPLKYIQITEIKATPTGKNDFIYYEKLED
jgi:long-chain acyl-CoA synthetase